MTHVTAGPHLHTESIEWDDTPTEALFRALSKAELDDRPPDVVLNDFVDPDALDSLFSDDRPAGHVGIVTFEAWGLLVNVTADDVSLYESVPSHLASDTGAPSGAAGRTARAGDKFKET
ncbi:HalOD1 output domain-containing protein [Halogeometricum limi]|uniref:Halobacterial output domain-containing protein n=1 Tax=Halogeometricum limi TaxID=555875 RepID=A0A1I6FV66_9EURY|nr:HalOD1 output domain-containing protein [Halogeometricum limi]SFR33842.1 hypothetical protein SAMN04488124_0366 [Halogeometricum limi]